ncbi:Diguanylate cyclase DosC [bioreactor metagenome]|uniref:Diguanylate cyclase DosC n=1 Tax=bioreactor metagenome TaxID=1076179 RepID=A0A645GTV6_9ZZZZ
MISAAQKLKESFPNELVGRIGGDEFIVLVEDVTDIEKVKQQAENIVSLLKIHSDNGDILVTCSVGITLFTYGDDFDQVLDQADKAMYHAKQKGRNQVSFYLEDSLR